MDHSKMKYAWEAFLCHCKGSGIDTKEEKEKAWYLWKAGYSMGTSDTTQRIAEVLIVRNEQKKAL